ncbi:epidermal growth factor receptor kinase substrate 8-like protein 3b isoform X2 [Dunckerocampus dactyliophorus]|uniref:epidermal growth factor receptor kinase substrate 8-like protein 3b isoform X2 n=1 Tax=Dunckerocampus dactyliophorus TaxID=161453 RepID=UPI0024049269|nr:epidermal growth factor receptor kinase substrate 8-like protein 3b isoform X2 [Dunckerocampus dactyliophorus]
MLGNSRPFSYSPRGFSPDELPQSRWAFQQDDYRGSSPQSPQRNLSRPTGKSIYMQRKEYSEVLNRQPDNLQARVEHVLTCELDGQQLITVDDCVAKVKRLDAKGRLWPQEMIMEVQGGYLLLCDTETKGELEALPLMNIQQTKAVLDSCSYDALLMVTAREASKHFPQVYIFQCEETGAEVLKSDLDKFVQRGGGQVESRRDQTVIRSNTVGPQSPGGFQQAVPRAVQKDRPYQSPLPPPERPLPQWTDREPGSFHQAGPRVVQRERNLLPPERPLPQWTYKEPEDIPPPRFYAPKEEPMYQRDLGDSHSSLDVSEQTDADRNTDILNHVLDDLEIFLGKVLAATNVTLPQQDDKSKKKGVFKKKNTKSTAVRLPPPQEFVSCLQKIKYGFNLLGQLDGSLANTGAPDYVHIFFNSLATILPHFHAHLPPTVVSPLLTDAALRLLRQVVSPEEDQLWRSLGDSWNIPRSRWPGDVPPYIPEFYDGWQPPAPPHKHAHVPHQNNQVSRNNSQRYPPGRPIDHMKEGRDLMRVMYDIVARNNRELTVMKGEVVEVVQRSKQWWLVRNKRGEDGNVPQNVLESIRSGLPVVDMRPSRGPASLNMASSPAEVRAWLQYKGFSKITVASLGVLTGRMLLQMGKDEMRTVCPEEGGKVFFQLQAIKSTIALASEPSGLYDGRY